MSGIARAARAGVSRQSRLRHQRGRRCTAQLVGDIERSLMVLLAAVGIRAADRVREPRQPAARADRGTPQGAGDSHRARRQARPADPPDRHRGVRARRGRRRPGLLLRLLGDAASSSRSAATAFRVRKRSRSTAGCCSSRWCSRRARALPGGLVPALQASRPGIADTLREGGREGAQRRQPANPQRAGRREVALAFVLLAGAGLLFARCGHAARRARVHGRSRRDDPPEPAGRCSTRSAGRSQLLLRLLESVRALPGVESAATGHRRAAAAASPTRTCSPSKAGRCRRRASASSTRSRAYRRATSKRSASRCSPAATFTDQDRADAPRVVVINETLAKQGWPGQDPIGRRMRGGGDNVPRRRG